jgi:hypothetical protein
LIRPRRECDIRLRLIVAVVDGNRDLPKRALRVSSVPSHTDLVRASPFAKDDVVERSVRARAADHSVPKRRLGTSNPAPPRVFWPEDSIFRSFRYSSRTLIEDSELRLSAGRCQKVFVLLGHEGGPCRTRTYDLGIKSPSGISARRCVELQPAANPTIWLRAVLQLPAPCRDEPVLPSVLATVEGATSVEDVT